MTRVAWSFNGELIKPQTKGGTATTAFAAVGERYLLADEFIRRGHNLILVQKMKEPSPYPGVSYDDTDIPDVDVAYFEWRWPMARNQGPNPIDGDWNRQVQLLDAYQKRGTPIVVFDTDMKVRPMDEFRWNRMIVGEPTISPSMITKKRCRLSWVTDFVPYHDTPDNPIAYSYLGNDYERSVQFTKYYGNPSGQLRELGIQTLVHGNWLERSADRNSPEHNLRSFPFVNFGTRLAYKDGMEMLSRSVCTANLAKDEYYAHGFITSRIYESILTGIPCLTPGEHEHLLSVGLGDWLITSPEDVVEKVVRLRRMSSESRRDIVGRQLEALKKLGDFSPACKVDRILAVGDGSLTQAKIDAGTE